jgi:cell division septum initiation protein DivIVA
MSNDWKPKSQTHEEVADGLRNAFRQAKKDGVMDATPYLKQMTFNTDIEKTEKEIAVLQKKLDLLKEIETHKSQPRMRFDYGGKFEIVSYENTSDKLAAKAKQVAQSTTSSLSRQEVYRLLSLKAKKRASGGTPVERGKLRRKVSSVPQADFDSDLSRSGLTQSKRDERRYTSGASIGPGGITKNRKKLRKQKVMGEFGEQADIYDIILSHLLDEGYAETIESAEAIMVNMSEEWRNSIIG